MPLALFLSASDIWAQLPVRLIAISAFVYVLVATLKVIFPALTGWMAITLNIVASVLGIFSVAKPGDFETPAFWASLMLAIAAAAGIHGTIKSTIVPAVTGTPEDKPSKSITKALVLLILAGSMLSFTGCLRPTVAAPLPAMAVDSLDANAYQALKPAHDFAASFSSDVIAGKFTLTPAQTKAMETLNKALNVADHASQDYHRAGGGNPALLNAAVSAALDAWSKAQASLAPIKN